MALKDKFVWLLHVVAQPSVHGETRQVVFAAQFRLNSTKPSHAAERRRGLLISSSPI
jgi:hypothetical protein